MNFRASFTLVAILALQVGCGEKNRRFSVEDGSTSSPASSASNNNSSTSSLNSFYHSDKGWASKVVFMVDSEASNDMVEAAKRAAKTWNESIGRDVLSYGGRQTGKHGASLYDSLNDDTTMLYLESNWLKTTTKLTSTLATTVWENASNDARVISKGDVIMNSENYEFYDSETVTEVKDPKKSVADTETVVLHEFGHLLGLNHIKTETDADSVMLAYTLIGVDVYQRTLSAGDIERIKALYPAP